MFLFAEIQAGMEDLGMRTRQKVFERHARRGTVGRENPTKIYAMGAKT